MTTFLHGCEVLEVDSGNRTVSTVNMAVIGMVLQAEDSAGATAASVTLGSSAIDDDITFTAVTAGNDGNAINITIEESDEAGAELAVSVSGDAITITLGNDDDGAASSTAYEVVTAVNADADASALVTASTDTAEDDSDVPSACSATFLEDGEDEPFPLDTPVLISGNESDAEDLGTDSDAYKYIKQIMEQYGALIVAVRVATDDDSDTQISNIVTGIEAFENAKSQCGYKPRILIAPGYSNNDSVAAKLESMAATLRAIAYVDMGSAATYTAAMKRTKSYGKRVEICWPWHTVYDTDLSKNVNYPPSVSMAGLRCRIDNENGVHYSKSNNEIYNLVGTSEDVAFELSSKTCLANILNKNKVSTTIVAGGYLHWGNRTCSNDSQWVFETSRRVVDMINDSIELSMMWAVDKPGTTQYLQDVLGSIQSYLRDLKNEGVIPGGTAWLSNINSTSNMAQGIYYFDFDIGLYYPGEHLIFRSQINDGYLEEVLENV
jgi:phage tail sheath protein FI